MKSKVSSVVVRIQISEDAVKAQVIQLCRMQNIGYLFIIFAQLTSAVLLLRHLGNICRIELHDLR